METLNIPVGYQQVMPYLIIANAADFLTFTAAVFGAIEKTKAMRDETTIMHAEVVIGDSVIMLADATEQHPASPASLFVYVKDCDQVYHKALANGATILSVPADQEYGRSAGIKDPFSNTWWITAVQ